MELHFFNGIIHFAKDETCLNFTSLLYYHIYFSFICLEKEGKKNKREKRRKKN